MASQNFKQRIKTLHSRFCFGSAGIIELLPQMGITSIVGRGSHIYLGQVDWTSTKDDRYRNAAIRIFDSRKGEFIEDLATDIRATGRLSLCTESKGGGLLYLGYNSRGNALVYKILLPGKQVEEFINFYEDKKDVFLTIKSSSDKVFFADIGFHTLRKYSVRGELEAQFETWREGFEFPLTIEVLDDENLFVAFGQERTGMFLSKLKMAEKLAPHSFARWNHVQNRLFPLNCDLEESKNVNSSVRTDCGDYFFSQGENLIKLDKEFKLVFIVNANDFLNKRYKKGFNSGRIKNLLLGYNNGRLYLTDFQTRFLDAIYSFSVDEHAESEILTNRGMVCVA